MFRKLVSGDANEYLPEDRFEYAHTFLADERRMLFLRGIIVGMSGNLSTSRIDQFSPLSVGDDITAMNVDDPSRPIYLLINSPGGSVETGLVLYDLIHMSRAPVITIGMGCASMATLILAAGSERLIFPHSKLALHLPEAVLQGDSREIDIQSQELERIKNSLVDCYMDCGVTAGIGGSGKRKPSRAKIKQQILKDIDRVFFLDAKQAVAYGLVDRIVSPKELFGKGK